MGAKEATSIALSLISSAGFDVVILLSGAQLRWGGSGGLDPSFLLQKDKSTLFFENYESSVKKCIDVITIKHE